MSPVVAKVIGTDFELANALLTPGHVQSRADRAAVLLLSAIRGYPQRRNGSGTRIEFDRRWLSGSGGSSYIDSDHLEMNTPEHLHAKDHALHVHAALRIARQAQVAASLELPANTQLVVHANNCDGHVSYGRHTNVMTTARCFDDILERKPHLGGFLATHLVTAVVYCGQGMVGAANGAAACNFQLAQRPDWFERFSGIDTMVHRPLLNTRNEPHAENGLARMHLIFHDMILSPIANWLLAGTTQLIVAMCEAGWVDPTLLLDDPVGAASIISRDLSLQQKFPTAVRGKPATAVELQRELALRAGEFVASGVVDDAVPGAAEIVSLWLSTLDMLQERDIEALASRCDNWLKWLLLERQRSRQGLSWESDSMRILDLQFSSLDPAEGLFFQMAAAGIVEGMPSDEQINTCVARPPEDTRAWLRSQILRRFGTAVYQMDWSWIEFRVPSTRGWSSYARVWMPDPRRHTREDCEATLSECRTLDDLVAVFGESAAANRREQGPRMNTSAMKPPTYR